MALRHSAAWSTSSPRAPAGAKHVQSSRACWCGRDASDAAQHSEREARQSRPSRHSLLSTHFGPRFSLKARKPSFMLAPSLMRWAHPAA